MIDRRGFVASMLVAPCAFLSACSQPRDRQVVRVFDDSESSVSKPSESPDAVQLAFAALVSPQESYSRYQNLVMYLESALGRPVNVVRKQTYEEVNDLLSSGAVDFAFICSLSYVLGMANGSLSGVAAPVVHGSSFYRSYIITRTDSGITSLDGLEGRKFAFSDPLSFTGRLSTLDLLHEQLDADERYFGEVFYTYSHDSSIQAVHLGTVDGASVDSIIYDQMSEASNEATGNTRVIYEGPFAGMPPVVASAAVDAGLKSEFERVLEGMDDDEQGAGVLKGLGYDCFRPVDDSAYDTVRKAVEDVGIENVREVGSLLRSGS